MGYQLEQGELLPDALKRIAFEQIDHARTVLDGPSWKRAEAAHTARKHIKKTRSLLRLVRDDLGEDVFSHENAALRDVADILAGARSADARVETFDVLANRYASELNAKAFRPIRRVLVSERRAAVRRLTSDDLRTAAGTLADVRARVNGWPIGGGFSTIGGGLKRSIEDGRASLVGAFEGLDSTAFHELRKQAKDLLYQSHVIRPLWPGLLKRFEREVKRLTDLLGEEHDFAGLTTWLADHEADLSTRCELGVVVALADQRRLEARTEAQPLATRIYAERPKAFIRRIRAYWKAYRRGVAGDVVGVVRVQHGASPGESILV